MDGTYFKHASNDSVQPLLWVKIINAEEKQKCCDSNMYVLAKEN
jgi:hypothetical protein